MPSGPRMWKYRIRKDGVWEEPQYRKDMKKDDYVFFEGEDKFEVVIDPTNSGMNAEDLFETGAMKFTHDNPYAGKIKCNLKPMQEHNQNEPDPDKHKRFELKLQEEEPAPAKKLTQAQKRGGAPRIPPG